MFGARSNAPASANISALTADNDFSSPDGLWFSNATPGLLWLQTDDGAYTDVTNCMMLAAVPGRVGDGGAPHHHQHQHGGLASHHRHPRVRLWGATPTNATLRRFLVGPRDCEITGITESPDGTAIFCEHPAPW